MEISAYIRSGSNFHELVVSTEGTSRPLVISAKPTGRGSAVNGGELLMAALATCYCNDLYREASRLGVQKTGVRVDFLTRPGEKLRSDPSSLLPQFAV